MTAVDVSPDGTQVVYSTCAYPTDPEFTYTPSTRHETDVEGNPIIRIVSVEPNPELLNFDHELVRARIDGSEPQRLTNNARFDNYPAWSPDGTRIAYLSNDNRDASASNPHSTSFLRLYTMAPDGSNVAMVRDGFVNLFQPLQWSPDGKSLAYVRQDPESAVWLYTVTVDGGAPRRLTKTDSYPSWSPNGQRLAFAKPDGAEVALYTIASDGSDAQRVTTIRGWQPRYGEPDPSRAWIGTVAWSPDGSKILFSCGGGICVVSLDGAPVNEAPLLGYAAAWSPDGSRIAILNTENGPVVQTVAPDGSDARVLVLAGIGGLIPAQSGHEDVQASQAACATGFMIDAPAENSGLVRDCEVLLELRDTLFGSALVNWVPGIPITQWLGVTVAGTPRRVTGLSLGGLVPTATLPRALGDMSQLRVLDLSYDHSYYSRPGAPIPPEFGKLSQLRVLKIAGGLRGRIPAELAELTNLRTLSLSRSELTGGIPPELGRLTNLQELFLYTSKLTGTIPPELGQLANLTGLSLNTNQLNGPIPSELGQLANLTLLDLARNQLAGPIPPALGQLGNLTRLILFYNQLSGPIPAELGQLGSLSELILYGNQLAGPIPPELGQLTNLTDLNLTKNQITGPIPPELGLLANLRSLTVTSNQLTGPIPPELGQLANLDLLRLDNNQLVGTIPAEFGQLTNLGTLGLSGNALTGEVPEALGRLNATLDLAGNQLTGCIPRGIPEWRLGDRRALGLPACNQR
ncbi:MAG: hypothetical protein OXG33_11340 [Chloroflexi bacterium]|nr:hypothetical protein [Chloroflexota bacterium]